MSRPSNPSTPAEAAARFAAELAAQAAGPPSRIEARLDSAAGMAGLCEVEAVLARAWPAGTAKELVWLTRSQAQAPEQLRLRAFGTANELLADALFELGHGLK